MTTANDGGSSDNKRYYDDFSGWYEQERHHGYHAMLDRLEAGIVEPLARDRDVLEVGCGTGLILKRLQGAARSLHGLDISRGMLAEARRRGYAVTEGSATDLPFADGSFDLAFSFKVLAHVPDIRRALHEMARVVRPGGHVVAEFYNRLSVRHLAKILGGPGRISAARTEAEVFTRWDTPRQAAAHLPAGLTVEGWRGVRVFTPAAAAFRVPGLSAVLDRAEGWAVDGPLARFGGFLVAVCKKN
jgi:ubiquinone/menaquinone biosynthesis C-methylase UbiE